MTPLGKYMYVKDPLSSVSGKTKVWWIMDRGNGTLGIIKWYSRWRCYAFFPEADTVFNAACMMELVVFCDIETKKQRNK